MSTITILMEGCLSNALSPPSTPQTAVLQQLLTSLRELGATSADISTASTPIAATEKTPSLEKPSGTKLISSLIWGVRGTRVRKNICLLTPEELWLAEVPAWIEVTQDLVEALYSALRKKTGPA